MNTITYGKVVVAMMLLIVATPMLPTVAQDSTSTATDTVDTIEEDVDTGILPTNPFYFLKEWGRELRRAFILNPVKRAEFELEITDEKANELKTVSNMDEDDERGIDRAINNYQKAVERLRFRLEQLDENSENPNIQELLDKLALRIAEHQELIARLRERYEEFENLRVRFEQAKEAVDGTIDSILNGVETIQEFREGFRTGDAEFREELRIRWQEFRNEAPF